MDEAGIRRESWTLTQKGLESLLARLDPDRERAAQVYEQLRRKLVTFFRCNDCWEAEDLVDETLDRSTRRLEEIEILEIMPFIRGVARRVASEALRSNRSVSLEEVPEFLNRTEPAADPEERLLAERRFDCLERCVKRLPQADRVLVFEYYRYSGSEKIEAKKQMAAALGVSPTALRVKAFRLRQVLDNCVTKCMERACRP